MAELVQWREFKANSFNIPLHKSGCYALICNATNKLYIGMSCNIANRFRNGYSAGSKINRALAKYGAAAFTVFPLFYAISKECRLKVVESELISTFNTIENGYNIIKYDDETRSYGKEFNAAVKQAMNREETKQLLREKRNLICKTTNWGIIHAAFMRAFMREQHKTEKRKAQLQTQLKERWRIQENREKQRAAISRKKWITDGINNKRIDKTVLLPIGWKYGRKL